MKGNIVVAILFTILGFIHYKFVNKQMDVVQGYFKPQIEKIEESSVRIGVIESVMVELKDESRKIKYNLDNILQRLDRAGIK